MASRKIEDAINDVLKDGAQQNALDFVTYLRANEIPLDESENYWEVKYRDECMCYLWIDGSDNAPGPWTVWSAQVPGAWPEGDHGHKNIELLESVQLIETVWANVNICGNCGGCDKPGGRKKTILGKGFDNVCVSTMAFTNPDTDALKCAKAMIEARKRDIQMSR